MQSIQLISAGKLSKKYWKEATNEFEKRLSAYCRFKSIEVKERGENQKDLCREAEDFRVSIQKKSFTVALCVEGRPITSDQLASLIKQCAMQGKDLCFIIGSSQGIDEDFKKQCDERISLSNMTFPHQMARVILTEQLYRAFNILSGGKYHK